MRFGVSTFVWSPRFEERDLPLLARAKDLGADLVEIQRSGFEGFPVALIQRELHRLELACTLSASPTSADRCIIAEDPSDRRAGIQYLRDAIAVARDLGARMINGPLYAPPWWFTGKRATRDQWEWAVGGFAEIAETLVRSGIEMAVEPINRFETFFLNTAAQGVTLCEAIGSPRIGLLLDIAHMVIEEKDPVAAIRAAGPWLRHAQLPESDRGTPGTGSLIHWQSVFEAPADIGYEGACTIESFPFSAPEFAMATRSWRDLASSSDALVRDGLAFLRATHAAAGQGRTE